MPESEAHHFGRNSCTAAAAEDDAILRHRSAVWRHHSVMDNTAAAELELSRLLLPIQPDDHVQGAADARYTLVEYGDYECPDCGQLFGTLCELRADLGDELRLAFRHYPRSGVHPHAQQAAEAAEAAGGQNRFWEMHDLLFRNQGALKTKNLERYAQQLALDPDRFHKDLKTRAFEQRVREDFRRGVANGVYGTPGLFINGVRYSGGLDRDSLLSYLRHVIDHDGTVPGREPN
jgi:protein-disulfide isomerase